MSAAQAFTRHHFVFKHMSLSACMALLLFAHLPFLSADADLSLYGNGSRGAWTDEGINTCQLRNFMHQGRFEILSSDNFLKIPLYSAYLYLPFLAFGSSLELARLFTVLFVLLTITLLCMRISRSYALFFALIGACYGPIFHHSHLAMPEAIASCLVLLALCSHAHCRATGLNGKRYLTLALLLAAVLMKVQYIYVLALPLAASLGEIKRRPGSVSFPLLKKILAPYILVLAVLPLLWYLPLRQEWEWIWAQQSGTLPSLLPSRGVIEENLKLYFFHFNALPFTLTFVFAAFTGIWLAMRKRLLDARLYFFWLCLGWALFESHKLNMPYLPIRYVLPLYISMASAMAIVFSSLFTTFRFKTFVKSPRPLQGLALVLLLWMTSVNAGHYAHSFKTRTFEIQAINAYVAGCADQSSIFIGPWAPTFTWRSKSYSAPIWNTYTPSHQHIQDPQVTAYITEWDDDDTGKFFKSRGTDLHALSDSTTTWNTARWKGHIFWMSTPAVEPTNSLQPMHSNP